MKKISFLSIAIVACLASCKKQDQATDTTQTISESLSANASYEYTLGAIPVQDIQINTQAAHASVSKITNVPLNTVTVYQYVPDSNYVGTDQVIVTIDPHSGCPGHKAGCNKNNGCKKTAADGTRPGKTTYTFNFTVGDIKPSK